jgi:hypothetical protein
MQAGAGKGEIRIPTELFPLEKFTAVHDPLYVRVLLLKQEKGFALVSVDMTSLREYAIQELRSITQKLTGVPETQIWICMTHTFSAPHTRSETALAKGGEELRRKNQGLSNAISSALKEAVRQANASMQPVQVGAGKGTCTVNISRDIETPLGWWLGQNEHGFSDHTLSVLRFDSVATGKTIAVLYNYDVQSSIMDGSKLPDGGCLVTGDLVGAASTYVEEAIGSDAVAVFLLGAAGDQSPREQSKHPVIAQDGTIQSHDLGEAGFALCKRLGEELGISILSVSRSIRLEPVTEPITFSSVSTLLNGQKIMEPRPSSPVKEYNFEAQPPRQSGAEIVSFGEIALAGVRPELSSSTAYQIRSHSPYPMTMVGTMVNGIDKYLPERSAYDRITYEAMNSAYGQGAAEQLTSCILKHLNQLRKE